jgi:hypothetical protein
MIGHNSLGRTTSALLPSAYHPAPPSLLGRTASHLGGGSQYHNNNYNNSHDDAGTMMRMAHTASAMDAAYYPHLRSGYEPPQHFGAAPPMGYSALDLYGAQGAAPMGYSALDLYGAQAAAPMGYSALDLYGAQGAAAPMGYSALDLYHQQGASPHVRSGAGVPRPVYPSSSYY